MHVPRFDKICWLKKQREWCHVYYIVDGVECKLESL